MNAGSIPAATYPAHRLTRRLASLVLLAAAAGCIPSTYGYLTVPLAVDRRPPPGFPTIVDLDIERLAASLDESVPERIVVYHTGRTPLPRRLVDTDGDGTADVIRVAIPAGRRLASIEILVITSPGSPVPVDSPAGEPTPGIEVLYDEIRR